MVIELVWPETVGWTDAEAAESQSDSSLNCGNDSVMHSASGGNGKRERGGKEARNFAGCCERRKGWRAALLLRI